MFNAIRYDYISHFPSPLTTKDLIFPKEGEERRKSNEVSILIKQCKCQLKQADQKPSSLINTAKINKTLKELKEQPRTFRKAPEENPLL
jgi:hypothetical protein